jgi:hypothetical protein
MELNWSPFVTDRDNWAPFSHVEFVAMLVCVCGAKHSLLAVHWLLVVHQPQYGSTAVRHSLHVLKALQEDILSL